MDVVQYALDVIGPQLAADQSDERFEAEIGEDDSSVYSILSQALDEKVYVPPFYLDQVMERYGDSPYMDELVDDVRAAQASHSAA